MRTVDNAANATEFLGWRHAPARFPFLLLVSVGALVILPLFFLVFGSLSSSKLLGEFDLADIGMQNYLEVYSSPSTYRVIKNTFVYTIGTVALSLSGGTALAWVLARTDIPFKTFFFVGITMSTAMPGLLQAMAWVLLLSPRMGYLNAAFKAWFGWPPYDIYSMTSMIALEGLRMIPAVFLMMWPILRHIPASLEETARTCGSSESAIFRRILLPLIMPGLLGVSLYIMITVIGVFDVPGIIGLPAGIYVFSTRIYAEVSNPVTANYGAACALSMVFLAILAIGASLYFRIIKNVYRFEVVTGKGYQPKQLLLGWRSKLLVLGLMGIYLLVTIVLPTVTLLWTSLTLIPLPPSWQALSQLNLQAWANIATYPNLWRSILNTVVVSVSTSAAVIALSFAVSYVLVRTEFRLKRWLDFLAFSPHAVPGVILGVSLLWLSLYADKVLPVAFYGTVWPMVIGFTILFLPFGTRATTAGLVQLHKELEEAAHVSGGSAILVFRTIIFPLLSPTFVIVFIWTFGHVFRFTQLPLMLFTGEKSQLLAVLLWYMWDSGAFNMISAFGLTLIAFLSVLSLVLFRLQRRLAVAGEAF